jgi:hypothetical protein
MNKRYTVFVSSTYADLQDERREVMQALLELDCIPVGMELFPAADEPAWTFIKQMIDNCDYYVVVIGGRYGSMHPDGLSYTEREYDYAVERGLPVIAFLHADPGQIAAAKSEGDPQVRAKLAAFRCKAEKKLCKQWQTPQELGGVVSRSLVQLIKRQPAVGWVRANRLPTQEDLQKTIALRERIEQLEGQLEQATVGLSPTEELACGEDVVLLKFRWLVSGGTEEHIATLPMRWNEITAVLSHRLYTVSDEYTLEKHFLEHIKTAANLPNQAKMPPSAILASFETPRFADILMQLVALGIAEIKERQVFGDGCRANWGLTDDGAHLAPRLAAMKRPTSRSHEIAS